MILANSVEVMSVLELNNKKLILTTLAQCLEMNMGKPLLKFAVCMSFSLISASVALGDCPALAGHYKWELTWDGGKAANMTEVDITVDSSNNGAQVFHISQQDSHRENGGAYPSPYATNKTDLIIGNFQSYHPAPGIDLSYSVECVNEAGKDIVQTKSGVGVSTMIGNTIQRWSLNSDNNLLYQTGGLDGKIDPTEDRIFVRQN